MQTEWLIIDGNNLVHQAPRSMVGDVRRDFASSRWRLARKLDELAGGMARRVSVIFDGTRGGKDEAFRPSSIEVRFCDKDMTADAFIERTVAAHPRPGQILVVTSDRAERETVSGSGAETLSCRAFLNMIDDHRTEMNRRIEVRKSTTRPATLGDFFPE